MFSSVNEISNDTFVEVFPNPSNGKFRIESKTEFNSIEITDILGKIIYQSELKNKNEEIDLADECVAHLVRLDATRPAGDGRHPRVMPQFEM